MGRKKIIALGSGIIALVVAAGIIFAVRMSGKANAEKIGGRDIDVCNVNFTEAQQKASYEKSNGTVNDKLEQMSKEFKENIQKTPNMKSIYQMAFRKNMQIQ